MSHFRLLEEDKENIKRIIEKSETYELALDEMEKFIGYKIKLAQKIAFDAGYVEAKRSVEV